MPGPKANPGKPYSRHRPRGSSKGLVMLPAEGCDLPVPPIPKGRGWSREERSRWRELWRSPQATQWDDSFVVAVAVYVVLSSAILEGAASAWHAQEFRHLGDKLALTPQGMTALGWRLDTDREVS